MNEILKTGSIYNPLPINITLFIQPGGLFEIPPEIYEVPTWLKLNTFWLITQNILFVDYFRLSERGRDHWLIVMILVNICFVIIQTQNTSN